MNTCIMASLGAALPWPRRALLFDNLVDRRLPTQLRVAMRSPPLRGVFSERIYHRAVINPMSRRSRNLSGEWEIKSPRPREFGLGGDLIGPPLPPRPAPSRWQSAT